MRYLYIITICFLLTFFESCTKKNADDFKCEPTGSFSSEVSVIFINSCMPCHSSSRKEAGIALDKYDEAIKVDPSLLLGVIRHEPGFLQMPRNSAKLSDCDIKKIEEWINQGSLDN